jgi:hypothetical protein
MTTTFAQKNLQATKIFLLAHRQPQTPNANSEQISILQEGDKYEADTTAP